MCNEILTKNAEMFWKTIVNNVMELISSTGIAKPMTMITIAIQVIWRSSFLFCSLAESSCIVILTSLIGWSEERIYGLGYARPCKYWSLRLVTICTQIAWIIQLLDGSRWIRWRSQFWVYFARVIYWSPRNKTNRYWQILGTLGWGTCTYASILQP